MAEAVALRVDVLGTFRADFHGEPVQVDTRKAHAMLALLVTALSDGSTQLARDRLATMLWPGVDDARARATLRRTLSVLIAATGDVLVADRVSVQLTPDAVRSDIVELRRLARSEDPEDLARAVGLVRGEFLAGFRLRDCEPFDAWVVQESDTLRREVGAILERLVLARLRRGELHAALADASRWLELDPLHEPAHRSVMRLLAWTGRRQDALDHYRRCVRVLTDELGVAPVRSTTAVFDAIRAGTLEPPRRGRPTVPPSAPTGTRETTPATQPTPTRSAAGLPPAPMVGRADALVTLVTAAGRPDRLVLVTGEAGVGRSRLIEEFALAGGPVVVARAHDGEAALSFAPIGDLLREAMPHVPKLDEDLAVEVSRVLPECLPPGRNAPAALESPGGRDRFFDAVLRTLAAAEVRAVVVEDIHAASPDGAELLSYLVHRLARLPCALVLTWREPGLPARHPVRRALSSGRLAENITAVPLRRLDAAEVRELVEASGADLDAVALHEQTAGLPLLLAEAIRAGRSDVLSVPVRDLLAGRLAEVTEETGQVLGALAVCGGLADIATLRSTSGRSDVETVVAVEEALSAGLVREESGGVAFTHDALRQVAHDELSLARRRLLHARAAEAGTAAPDTYARSGQIAHHWHEAGFDDRAVTAAWVAAVRAAELFAHEEALRHLEFVVGLDGDRVEVALAEGDALVALGRYEQALVSFERAAAMAVRGPVALRARIERRSADVQSRVGERALADAGLAAAAQLLRADDEPELLSQVLADRALIALPADPSRAAELIALAADVAGGDVAYVCDVAGLVSLQVGDLAEAQRSFAEALAASDNIVLRAAVLNNLAHTQAAAGDLGGAVRTAREALVLGEQHGDRHRLAALHANLADRLHEFGEVAESREHLKLAAALFAEVGADPLDRPAVWTLTSW